VIRAILLILATLLLQGCGPVLFYCMIHDPTPKICQMAKTSPEPQRGPVAASASPRHRV
jgi:hypothetical protein